MNQLTRASASEVFIAFIYTNLAGVAQVHELDLVGHRHAENFDF